MVKVINMNSNNMNLEQLLATAQSRTPIKAGELLADPNNVIWSNFYGRHDTIVSEVANVLAGGTTGLTKDQIISKFAEVIAQYKRRTGDIKSGNTPPDVRLIEEGEAERIYNQIQQNSRMDEGDYLRMLQREGIWALVNTYLGSKKQEEEQMLFGRILSKIEIPKKYDERISLAKSLQRVAGLGQQKPEEIGDKLESYFAKYLVDYRNATPAVREP